MLSRVLLRLGTPESRQAVAPALHGLHGSAGFEAPAGRYSTQKNGNYGAARNPGGPVGARQACCAGSSLLKAKERQLLDAVAWCVAGVLGVAELASWLCGDDQAGGTGKLNCSVVVPSGPTPWNLIEARVNRGPSAVFVGAYSVTWTGYHVNPQESLDEHL